MEYIVTGQEMKSIDRYSIETIGIPSVVLMERAALAVVSCIKKKEKKTSKVGIVVGVGNNGADGLAVARILKEEGFEHIVIYAVGNIDKATKEWQIQRGIVEQLEIPLYFERYDFDDCDVIVDGIFGIGLTREVTGIYKDVIEQINNTSANVYAIDIPSGVNAENGKIMGCAVKADTTVTFGFAKVGCMLYPGAEYSGKVEVALIGFPQKAVSFCTPSFVTYGIEDLNKIPKRSVRSNKGTFGKVLVIAGDAGMSGAAYFSASAAYACGAGLVQVFTAEENRSILQTQLPEAIVKTWGDTSVEACCKWADVIAIGPGLGIKMSILVETVLKESTVPIVIDADALNLLAQNPQWKQYNKGNWIITPHPGEMSRLLGKSVKEIIEDFLENAKEIAKTYVCIAVCKDARTIVDSGRNNIYINNSGNNAMAKGGSGDVLTGVIAGLIACGIKQQENLLNYIEEMTRLGVFIHGLAGDVVRKKKGAYSLLASDLVESLSEIFCEIEEKR